MLYHARFQGNSSKNHKVTAMYTLGTLNIPLILFSMIIVKKQYLLLTKFYRKQILGALDLREEVQALCEMLTLLFAEVFLKGGC